MAENYVLNLGLQEKKCVPTIDEWITGSTSCAKTEKLGIGLPSSTLASLKIVDVFETKPQKESYTIEERWNVPSFWNRGMSVDRTFDIGKRFFSGYRLSDTEYDRSNTSELGVWLYRGKGLKIGLSGQYTQRFDNMMPGATNYGGIGLRFEFYCPVNK